MVLIGARLAYLQTSQHVGLTMWARAQQLDVEPQAAPRGLILDRQGRELARSLDVDSFFADLNFVEDECATAQALAPLVGATPAALEARLRAEKAAGHKFVWLARELEPEQAERFRALGLKSVGSVKEPK
ncbi:MAG TPA: hypothetical protein VF654_00025, partial [Pyrinomonadaceae bacterium]